MAIVLLAAFVCRMKDFIFIFQHFAAAIYGFILRLANQILWLSIREWGRLKLWKHIYYNRTAVAVLYSALELKNVIILLKITSNLSCNAKQLCWISIGPLAANIDNKVFGNEIMLFMHTSMSATQIRKLYIF